MKRLLLLFALATPVYAENGIDPKTAEFCMKASDFAGCVETMKRGIAPKQTRDAEEGLRTWIRDTGTVVKMRTNTVKARKLGHPEYGRYISFIYTRGPITGSFYNIWTGQYYNNLPAKSWTTEADCQDYTANWEGDGGGWIDVKDPDKYVGSQLMDSVREINSVLREFCPQMDRLVEEAKERDRLNPPVEKKNSNSRGGRGVWDDDILD